MSIKEQKNGEKKIFSISYFIDDFWGVGRHFTSQKYFFLQGAPIETVREEGSDWDAVYCGKISVSPIYLQPINHYDKDSYIKALDLNGG